MKKKEPFVSTPLENRCDMLNSCRVSIVYKNVYVMQFYSLVSSKNMYTTIQWFGVGKIFNVYETSCLCSPRLHLFIKNKVKQKY